jgi:PAS domain S-box-containing protein
VRRGPLAVVSLCPIAYRYLCAILLAAAAQLATLPFNEPRSVSLVLFAPFVVVSAMVLGLGPGLLTTTLCALEASYFLLDPIGSFGMGQPRDWDRLGALIATGVTASVLAEWRRRTKEQLAEAHRKAIAFLESISDGFNAFDREWRYTYVNSAAAKMVGKTPTELLGKNIWELWPQAWDSPFGAAYRRAVAENVTLRVEAFYPEPLNLWFDVRCYPSTEGLSLFFSDITERKRIEEKLLLLSSIVENSDDAIVSKDLAGIIMSWNKGAEKVYGYTSDEIVGQHISVLCTPDRQHEFTFLIDDLRRGASIQHYETQRIRKDGERIFVSLTMSPIRDSQQRIIGASAVGRDITESKLAEHALLLSEERYRSLALATSQIVWNTNAKGQVDDDLPMWRQFTGQTREEVAGLGWMNALHPDDRKRLGELWSRAIRTRSLYSTDFRIRRHDAEYRYIAVHGVPVLEQDGTVREWVGTCADITARVEAEEEVRKLNESLEKRVLARTAELEAANRELEAFAYSVSHDLRAPLRAVDGFSRILLEEYAAQLPAEAQRYLEIARNNAVQMGNLIDGLLAFSRLGRQEVHKQFVAPSDLVRQVLEDLGLEKTGRQVEISVGYLPGCEGDPFLLKQVFVNLLSNAFKYTRTREIAKIEIASLDPATYYVRDNGVGFDMRYSDKLFGVFQRLHRAEEYEGTGVGLAIVQRIIHRLGGRIWADAALDQGATFYFTLPTSMESRQNDDSLGFREEQEEIKS